MYQLILLHKIVLSLAELRGFAEVGTFLKVENSQKLQQISRAENMPVANRFVIFRPICKMQEKLFIQ